MTESSSSRRGASTPLSFRRKRLSSSLSHTSPTLRGAHQGDCVPGVDAGLRRSGAPSSLRSLLVGSIPCPMLGTSAAGRDPGRHTACQRRKGPVALFRVHAYGRLPAEGIRWIWRRHCWWQRLKGIGWISAPPSSAHVARRTALGHGRCGLSSMPAQGLGEAWHLTDQDATTSAHGGCSWSPLLTMGRPGWTLWYWRPADLSTRWCRWGPSPARCWAR